MSIKCTRCKSDPLSDQKRLYACDLCSAQICKQCSGVEITTEERVLELKERKLVYYYCPECSPAQEDKIDKFEKLKQENKQLKEKIQKMNKLENKGKEDEIMKVEKEKILLENDYLKQILKEVQDKNNILKLNNELLLQRIKTLEESSKNVSVGRNNVTYSVMATRQNEQQHQQNLNSNRLTIQATSSATQRAASLKSPTIIQQMGTAQNIGTNRSSNKQDNSKGDYQQEAQQSADQDAHSLVDNDFQIPKYQKRRFVRKRLGEGVNDGGSNSFSAAQRRAWIYINRIDRHVNSEMIKDYILKKPNFDIGSMIVREIPSEPTKLRRFVVVVPFNKKDEVYDTKFWPQNVV